MAELPEGAIALGHDTYYVKIVDKDGKWIAIDEFHLHPSTGKLCGGFVAFDVQSEWLTPGVHKWTVNSYDPLDLSPSLQCGVCNHHGYIRNGEWVPA